MILLLMISFLCTACGNDGATSTVTDRPEAIEVQVQMTPEEIHPDEEITIKAIVTQGDEKVDDANEVMFEIWKDGEEEHEMIEASHQDGGIYAIETNFAEAGTYHVTAHTTARNMHVMPEVELKVNKKSG